MLERKLTDKSHVRVGLYRLEPVVLHDSYNYYYNQQRILLRLQSAHDFHFVNRFSDAEGLLILQLFEQLVDIIVF